MSVWKTFCRTIESRIVREHFGDLTSLADSCALFEFSAEQIEKAVAYQPQAQPGEAIVPPFPFPRLCCLGPGGVIMLREPTMDPAGILRYEIFICTAIGTFASAICEIDTTAEALGVRYSNIRSVAGGRYWDNATSLEDTVFETVDFEVEHADTLAKAREFLARADAEGDAQRAAKVRHDLVELKAAHERVAEIERARAATETEWRTKQRELIQLAFEVGLKEVQWINKPDHFTVEVGSLAPPRKKGKDKSKDLRARRLHDRIRHIVLTKLEIAEAWRRVHRGGTHASPVPHLRRGHYRRLKPSTPDQEGRVVWVRAAHVNGQCVEWREGDVRYRVQ